MINPGHFTDLVIRPTILRLGMHSLAAERLLLGTALAESWLSALTQVGGGPARGLYQIEPATEQDVWRNYLRHRPALIARIQPLMTAQPRTKQVITNLAYATAIARLIYWRRPEPLPDADDLRGLGEYYKDHFNTRLGKGSAAAFVRRLAPRL